MTTRALLEGWRGLKARGDEFVIATVVDVRGSSYRRPGARMLVSRERWISGSVSGGCLEGDIVQKGFWRTSQGPIVMTYDSRVDADAEADDELRAGLGLGCNGVVDVLLERAGATEIDPLDVLETCVRTQTCAVVATVIASSDAVPIGARLAIRGDELYGGIGDDLMTTAIVASAKNALRARQTSIATYGDVRVLVEVFVPPPRLFVLGAGHDAVPLATMARATGWQVFACMPHARPAAHERFALADGFVFGPPADIVRAIGESDRAAAVIMSHNYAQDRDALGALAASDALYIGVLGPRHRTARMLGELELTLDARMHAPVGLAIGAETPEEIAVAIVAEVQAVLAEAPASRLRDRIGPIHTPVELSLGTEP